MKNTWLIGSILALALVGLGFLVPPPSSGISKVPGNTSASESSGSVNGSTEKPHTVIVIAAGETRVSALVQDRACGASSLCKNGTDDIDVGVLKSGVIPKQPTEAVVQTDTNCDPDANGISHCSNILRLADGSLIEVQHDHNMQVYPCLDPGDTVTVESQSSVS
ncbi:MAG TPA: hypothetical protein VMV38_00690 [Candidatus Paceibacterota bacterium]|nr:hypothetical protein [Candidatus Paceibacterota bacterium]